MLNDSLGEWLDMQRRNSGAWLKALYVALALLLVANIFILPHEPHFGYDGYFGFWALFGWGGAVIMTLVLKKGIFLLIGKAEDFYDRKS